MKAFFTLVASALLLATSVQGHAHVGKRHRGGPSATLPPPPTTSTTVYVLSLRDMMTASIDIDTICSTVTPNLRLLRLLSLATLPPLLAPSEVSPTMMLLPPGSSARSKPRDFHRQEFV